ncbi:aldehyde dehydrogenase [Dactylosporangium roseum]|uniref:Aldehyde dehydrogenase n=1 Tax=Dactylosporangium roseum TaxID=47989 RepID=A0ABY5ZC65_9ACTN|nr:aldehyde dehydrogenase [Dactylosporangium roseum]UWZ39715.1 aldehyde dehydrogenase [Dactylosporangium roseum]
MNAVPRYEHWIEGGWHTPLSRRYLETFDPSDGRPWAYIASGDSADVDRAVEAARKAFPAWSARSPRERGALLMALADAFADHAEELALVESRDNGKLLREVRPLIQYLPEYFRYFGEWADKISGDVISADKADMFAFREWAPIGVCALVTPWNSPLYLLSTKLPAALAAGNTVVVKPSEHASASTLELVQVLEKAGLPSGVVNVVTGLGPDVGAALVRHPHVGKVAFTGGLAGARSVIKASAENLAKLSLELGGKSPQLVFGDADTGAAVAGVLAGVFAASGQSCVAGSRVYVQRGIYEPFVAELVSRAQQIKIGPPSDPDSDIGPVAVRDQLDSTSGLISDAVALGARVAVGGTPWEAPGGSGWYFRPTVLCDVPSEAAIAREEVFGPVVVITPFDTEQEAVRLANDTEYGLAAGIWTRDLARAHRLIPQMQTGLVWVNTYRVASPTVPFGGWGLSGYGLEGGREGLLEFMHSTSVWINTSSAAIDDPFRMR